MDVRTHAQKHGLGWDGPPFLDEPEEPDPGISKGSTERQRSNAPFTYPIACAPIPSIKRLR